jgi:hypothetical protein
VDQLTLGAVHFGWDKVRGQAKQLVKRYLKFQGLLPAAESKLASQLQLLIRTPAQERPALVCRMRQELREHATSESAAGAAVMDGNEQICLYLCAACTSAAAHVLMMAPKPSLMY